MISRMKDRWHGWDSSRRLIAVCLFGIVLLALWAGLARVDEVTRGVGKVIPSSKVQLVQAVEPSVVGAIMVRSGQLVQKGELLGRLESAQSQSQRGQLQVENERLSARANRLANEGGGAGAGGGGYDQDRAPARSAGAKAKGGKGPSEDFSRPDFDDEIPF